MNPNINEKIIEAIEEKEIPKNQKKFLKEALELEFENRDKGGTLKDKYTILIEKYYGDEK